MTDPDRDLQKPDVPQGAWDLRNRVEILTDWLAERREWFTDAAIERSALAAGYTPEEFAAAVELADARAASRASLAPIKAAARWGVLAAYGLVWLAFASVYLGLPSRSDRFLPEGNFLQFILTVALGIGLAISLLTIRAGHPDPSRSSRALVILLVVPIVLLVGVAGLCFPFVPNS